MSTILEDLLARNKIWSNMVSEHHPSFFKSLAKEQIPPCLWIGCSDSRVPETTITDSPPGIFFVHRNIANMVISTDTNLLSTIYYATTVLNVQHIIVCGHYGCGGIRAAMSQKSCGYLDHWLLQIKQIYQQHQKTLHSIKDLSHREDRLVELNVIEQVKNIAKIPFIQSLWATKKTPLIHGWVYQLNTGQLTDLQVTINSHEALPAVNQYASDKHHD